MFDPSVLDLLEDVFLSERVDDLLLLLLDHLLGLHEAGLPLQQLAVLNEAVAGVDLLQVGIGSVSELLLPGGDALLLGLLVVDESLLLAGDSLGPPDLVLLDLELVTRLVVLLSECVLEVEDLLQLGLLVGDLGVELAQLVIDVLLLLEVLLQLLLDLVDLLILGIDVGLQGVDLLIQLVSVLIECIEFWFNINGLLDIGYGLLEFLDFSHHLLLVSEGHGCSLKSLLHLSDLLLNLSGILHVLILGKVLEELLLLEVERIDLLLHGLLLFQERVLLRAERLDFLDLLAECLSEGHLGAAHLAALASLLLLLNECADGVAGSLDLAIEVLHFLLELLLARLLLPLILRNDSGHFGLQSNGNLLELGSRCVQELVHPGVLVEVLAGTVLSLVSLATLLVSLTIATFLASLIVRLVLEVAAGSLGSLLVVATTATTVTTTTGTTLTALLTTLDLFFVVATVA